MVNKHIYLTGYRGTGKTTVGAELAARCGRRLIDLDRVIEAEAGKSIRDIFEQGGESMFRRLESEALSAVSTDEPAVVALGGGAILAESNRRVIRATGTCVWLTADAETILRRIEADAESRQTRPPLTQLDQADEVRKLLADRQTLYDESADHRVSTEGKSIAEVVEQVYRAVSP